MKKTSRFTLVELVMSLGIAVLAVTLLVGAVPEKEAKITACAAQLAALEKITAAYETDFGGTLISGNNNRMLWGTALARGGYFRETGFFTRNGNQPKVMECPAETRVRQEDGKKFDHPTMGCASSYDYGVNWFTHSKITGSGKANIARAALKAPAKLIRITEGTKFALHSTPESVTGRHGEDAGNVLFEDGHVTFMPEIPYKDAAGYQRSYWWN